MKIRLYNLSEALLIDRHAREIGVMHTTTPLHSLPTWLFHDRIAYEIVRPCFGGLMVRDSYGTTWVVPSLFIMSFEED